MASMRGVAMGQAIALCVALLSLVSKSLNDFHHVSSPALQISCGYFAVFALCIGPFLRSFDRKHAVSPVELLFLFCIAVCDSQGDFLTTVAFRFGASIASFGILTSFTVPFAMILSHCLLQTRYGANHFLGAATALLGMVIVLWGDRVQSTAVDTTAEGLTTNSNNNMVGDLMLVAGSAFWACANVACEALLKRTQVTIVTYLVIVSAFGMCFTTAEFLAWELNSANTEYTKPVAWLFAAYAALFAFQYVAYAKFLAQYDAVLVNLSVLTADVWGALFSQFIFHERVPMLKFVAFASTALGILAYSWKKPVTTEAPQEQHAQQEQAQEETPYEAL